MKSAMEKSARKKSGKSPYLTRGRLADIIHAVAAMGLHPMAGLLQPKWDGKLGKPGSVASDSWSEVFKQHPEFFHVRDKSISLQLRKTYDKNYDVKTKRLLSPSEVEEIPEDERATRLSSKPLNTDEIGLLVRTAIELHSRAIADQEAKRWWRVPSLTAVCAIVGGAIGMGVQWFLNTCK